MQQNGKGHTKTNSLTTTMTTTLWDVRFSPKQQILKYFQNKFHSNTTNEPKQYQLRRMHVTGTSTTTCLFCCCSSSSSSTTAFYTILDWFQFYLHLFLLFLLLVTVTANTVWLNFKLARMEIGKSLYNSRTFVKYLECNFLIGYICTYVCI